MSKQLGLKDFDGLVEVPLTLSVARLIAAGWSLRRIQRKLKLRNHQNVAYHRDKAVKQRVLRQSPIGWVVDRDFIPSVSRASKGCQKPRAHGGAGWRLTAKDYWKCNASPSGVQVEGGALGKARLGACEAPRSRWGKHFVKGIFPIKREPDWVKVRELADRVVGVKPEQFVFYDGSVTLTVRSRSVRVDVFGCEGESVEAVLEQGRERSRVFLGDFLDSFGGELREGMFSTSNADWTLDKELSKSFLKFKPGLADSSHPRQVEVSTEVKERIDLLLDGGLEERLSRLESNLERVVSVLERLAPVGKNGVGVEPDWRDRA